MNAASVSEFGRVAVLMGGWSAEREISLLSGQAVFDALREQGVDAHVVDVDRQIDQRLRQDHFDRAFNILHGTGGEDGVIQGLLELLELPYTGSGVMASALSMDKIMTKRVWHAGGLATPDFMTLTAESNWAAVVQSLGLPLVVKPACEGSSIGITRVDDASQMAEAWATAAKGGSEVLAEQWIEGEEYTVAILNDVALPAIRLETPHAFYDFDAKYAANDTHYYCPCGLAAEEEATLQSLSKRAFDILGAKGWGRIDLMRDSDGKDWLIELNTIPGMTSHSLVPKAAAAAGMDFNALVLNILRGVGRG
ncbi:MAG: D-alanine--D-alanine ligase [Thiothrix sp.]|nr:MAG: D-alanine--D-alanine ligase [Thiothrix sp.]